jgi:hypothetical protein
MSTSVVAMQIRGDRGRAEEILAAMGERLGRGPITPEESGYVPLLFGIAYEESWPWCARPWTPPPTTGPSTSSCTSRSAERRW